MSGVAIALLLFFFYYYYFFFIIIIIIIIILFYCSFVNSVNNVKFLHCFISNAVMKFSLKCKRGLVAMVTYTFHCKVGDPYADRIYVCNGVASALSWSFRTSKGGLSRPPPHRPQQCFVLLIILLQFIHRHFHWVSLGIVSFPSLFP